MGSLEYLLTATDEMAIARSVGSPHDEARMRYALHSNSVESFEEFTDVITDYYNYHVGRCVVHGGYLSRTEAAGRAKEILDREYRRQGGDIISAYKDARDGTSGGLRVVLDRIAEHLKAESVERYIREAFDRYVEPNSWEQKVDIIHQFIAQCGQHLSSSMRTDQPERYAHNYQELIRTYVESLKKTSSVFRRL
ncbi:MAG: hypothetical protein SWH78_12800 [Thermodesulfobacteriota bacterium]|nr:hypothetical protein [Thermodesulfobacteriota bacterium]